VGHDMSCPYSRHTAKQNDFVSAAALF
jgi:hypothetical protein